MKIIILLLLSFFTINVISQENIWRRYHEKKGFCSTTLEMYSDSTYLYETGCEGRSHVNFGQWKIDAKKIILIPIDTSDFNYIDTIIESYDPKNDSTIVLKIMDKYDIPIDQFGAIFVPEGINHEDILGFGVFRFKKGTEPEIVIKPLITNSNGTLNIQGETNGILKLLSCKGLFHKDVLIEIKNQNPNQITVRLNLFRQIFRYPDISWMELKYTTIKNEKNELIFITE